MLNNQFSVFLINPPVIFPKDTGGVDIYQPLGIAYLAAVLRNNNYPVSIIDAPGLGWRNIDKFDDNRNYNGLSYKEIGERIKKTKPKVVGITITFTVQKDSAFRVAEVIKKINKNIIVIVGGPHVTVRTEECLLNPNVDFAVVGEGEETIIELLNTLQEKKPNYKNINGIAYKENKKIQITKPRPYILDLDKLPFPARDLLPMQNYFQAAKEKRASRDLNKNWATIITSRGCPFNCVFCSQDKLMGRRWRGRSPENVISEIKELIDKYNIKQIDFEDDNISCNKERMVKICDLIIENGLKFEWFTPNGVRADTLNEQLLRKMKKSGCRELWFAPESGSQRVVDDIIGKRIDLKYIEKMVDACKRVGISSNCFFVIGLPGETKNDIKKSISFSRKLGKLGADNSLFSIATPLYGTRLYKEVMEKGYLVQNESKFRYDMPQIETPEFSIRELLEMREEAMKSNRKLFIINSIHKFGYYLTNNPKLALEQMNNIIRIGLLFLSRKYNQMNKND